MTTATEFKFERGDEETERRIAYHEAGHALAALIGRRRFEYVTVVPVAGESEGHLHDGDDAGGWCASEISRLGQRFFAREVRIDLGGMAAEMAALGIRELSAHDFNSAIVHAWILMEVPGDALLRTFQSYNDAPEPIQRYLRDTLERLVRAFVKRSGALISLANALEERKRLTWHEAVAVVKGAA